MTGASVAALVAAMWVLAEQRAVRMMTADHALIRSVARAGEDEGRRRRSFGLGPR